MSVKLTLLKSGEQVVSDVKELVSEESVRGYVFNKPQKVTSGGAVFLTEQEEKEDNNVQVTLAPYILLTKDDDIAIPTDWVVTIVEPLTALVEMYQEKINGQDR